VRFDPLAPERLAQAVDVDLERLDRRARRRRAPERVDERLARDDVVRAQQEQRKQGALLRPAER
jgi:hypothetical protein